MCPLLVIVITSNDITSIVITSNDLFVMCSIAIFFAENDIVVDVGVLCNSEDITLTLTVTTDTFNGMIYPKGLSKNSTCMTEYIQQAVS